MSGRNSAHLVPFALTNADSEIRVAGTEARTFLAIYYRHFRFVWSSVKYLGVRPDAIDDVVQDIFMVVHSKLHTQRHPGALRSWIYGIVLRTVSTHRRSNRSRNELEARWGQARVRPPATPEQLAERNEQVELLTSLLAELDEAKREVFVAVELEEMTVPEIAAALKISVNTAYSRLRAGRHAFEEQLARRIASERGNE